MGYISVKMCVKLCSEMCCESISGFKMTPHAGRQQFVRFKPSSYLQQSLSGGS